MKLSYSMEAGLLAACGLIVCGCASTTGVRTPRDGMPPVVVAVGVNADPGIVDVDEVVTSTAEPVAVLAEERAAPQGGVYTVRRGDNLSMISAETGVAVEEIAALNGISNPNRIRVGQVLALSGDARAMPVIGSHRPAKMRQLSGGTYIVQPGDTLSDIASSFKTTIAAIKSANNLKSDVIRVGRSLVIPKVVSPVSGVAAVPAVVSDEVPAVSLTDTQAVPVAVQVNGVQ